MKQTACFALFAVMAIGPQVAVAQVADTVPPPPQRQQRMEMRSQRMADRMGVNHQRMAGRQQRNQQRMQGDRQSRMQGRPQGRARGFGGSFSPSTLLRQQQSLGLSPEQVTQLEVLRDELQTADAQGTSRAQAILTDEQRGRVRGRADARRMGGRNQRGMTRAQPSRRMRPSRGRGWRPI